MNRRNFNVRASKGRWAVSKEATEFVQEKPPKESPHLRNTLRAKEKLRDYLELMIGLNNFVG